MGLLLAAGVLTGGVAAAVAEEEPVTVTVTAPEFEVRGRGDARAIVPIHRFTAAEAVVPAVAIYASAFPGPTETPTDVLSNPTWEGFPLVVSVIAESHDGSWLHVRLPKRPNGSTGWVRASDFRTWEVPNRIVVQLSTNTLRVYEGDSDRVLFEAIVATGRGSTPTPVGEFYIDIVNPLGNHRTYGWGQLSVAGFSEVLHSFGGGTGQIAIHGWHNDDVMGSAVSNGCVRMRNVDIARVAELAPLGTPVSIIP